jgi:peroxiredoxin
MRVFILSIFLIIFSTFVYSEDKNIAPPFTLSDLKGNEVSLDSLLTQGPVVLGFWATWCKPCIKELDFWRKLRHEFDSITFVGINEDGPRSRKKVPIIVKSHNWKFLVLFDDNKKVMKLYQVKAIPHTFIIGKGRKILFQHIGFTKKYEKSLYQKLSLLRKKSE